ncbi:C-type lectin domain family 10 member A [Triplophysa tibetana]|uniref:C-type lectin domain family 10 member A n=1 Tax=Triplophysa tibetana TaxID=1572043 RepID=A0A5A9N3E1_9TELE|nr:C-type lectin domain family 10 member A [Triplophysa tibetana]
MAQMLDIDRGERIEMMVDIYESSDSARNHEVMINTDRQQALQHTDRSSDNFKWIYYNFSFYYVSSAYKSWSNSRQDCEERGADLVIINSKEEQEFLQKVTAGYYFWIGLRRENEVWKWINESTSTTRDCRNTGWRSDCRPRVYSVCGVSVGPSTSAPRPHGTGGSGHVLTEAVLQTQRDIIDTITVIADECHGPRRAPIECTTPRSYPETPQTDNNSGGSSWCNSHNPPGNRTEGWPNRSSSDGTVKTKWKHKQGTGWSVTVPPFTQARPRQQQMGKGVGVLTRAGHTGEYRGSPGRCHRHRGSTLVPMAQEAFRVTAVPEALRVPAVREAWKVTATSEALRVPAVREARWVTAAQYALRVPAVREAWRVTAAPYALRVLAVQEAWMV